MRACPAHPQPLRGVWGCLVPGELRSAGRCLDQFADRDRFRFRFPRLDLRGADQIGEPLGPLALVLAEGDLGRAAAAGSSEVPAGAKMW